MAQSLDNNSLFSEAKHRLYLSLLLKLSRSNELVDGIEREDLTCLAMWLDFDPLQPEARRFTYLQNKVVYLCPQ